MSARDDMYLFAMVGKVHEDGNRAMAQRKLDAYRTEVISKAVGRLRAIPVDCTALTGPVWYGDGWNSAITCLEEIADYQTPDDEAYPGELQRLRSLALAVRVAAVCKGDLAETQQVLERHDAFETAAREKTAPDFFVPGRTYTNTDRYKLTVRFACEHATVDPQNGRREAWGWLHRANGSRRMERKWADDFPNWTPAAGDGRG